MEKAELVPSTKGVSGLWKFARKVVIANGLVAIFGYGLLFCTRTVFLTMRVLTDWPEFSNRLPPPILSLSVVGLMFVGLIMLIGAFLLHIVVPIILSTNLVLLISALVAAIRSGSFWRTCCSLPWKNPQFLFGISVSLLCYIGCALFLLMTKGVVSEDTFNWIIGK